MMTVSQLRECTDTELNGIIKESQQAILDMRHQAACIVMPIEKPHLIRAHKKLIARCKTVLKEQSCIMMS
jgi:ribosomal protein L29